MRETVGQPQEAVFIGYTSRLFLVAEHLER